MTQATLNVRMDKELKDQFAEFCDSVGMSMSTAVSLFAKTTVKNKELPFRITARRRPADYREARSIEDYNEETQAIIRETYEHPERLEGPYHTVEEALEALHA